METNGTDPEYRNLFRKAKEQYKQIPRSERSFDEQGFSKPQLENFS
jgi:hypothetical protein